MDKHISQQSECTNSWYNAQTLSLKDNTVSKIGIYGPIRNHTETYTHWTTIRMHNYAPIGKVLVKQQEENSLKREMIVELFSLKAGGDHEQSSARLSRGGAARTTHEPTHA